MDVSKLPRLSDTKAAAGATGPAEPEPTASLAYQPRHAGRPPGLGVDVWVSTIIGLLFVGLGLQFGRYAAAKLAHRPFPTNVNWTSGPKAGQPVGYFELDGYTAWSDASAFFFGLTLLAEAGTKAAVVLRPGRVTRAGLWLAMGLTLATVLLNVGVAFTLFGIGVLPVLSGLAVAFGGWVLYDEWETLRLTQPVRAVV